MANRRRRTTTSTAPARQPASGRIQSLRFSGVNAALAAAGLLSLAIGYWMLAQGSVTAAPLLLVVGYVVLLPLAIIL